MTRKAYIKHIGTLLAVAASLSLGWAAAACDSTIYDPEGDCSTTYLVGFTDSYNLLYADAFDSEVEAVHLYVLEHGTGKVATIVNATVAQLIDGCVKVDVAAGCYDLVAWCTGSTYSATAPVATAFQLPASGAATRDELGVTLSRDTGGTVAGQIERLFHGVLLGAEFPETEGVYRFTVPLVKDTNRLRVVLQHADSNVPVSADDFIFTVTDGNGRLAWDNSLLPDETLTYRPWSIDTYAAQMPDPDNPNAATSSAVPSAVAAEFTLSRLVKRTDDAPRLRIRRAADGETVLTFPVIDLALLLRSRAYEGMPDQEFLDRQESYDCVFFLDESNRWLNAYIYINSWVIILQDIDF